MGNSIIKGGGNKKVTNYAAIAVFFGQIKGTVEFVNANSNANANANVNANANANANANVQININLSGFEPNTIHGFHIHRCGDMSKMCDSMCDHFNPYNKTHGGGHNPSNNRHVGDLGNITADAAGNVNIIMYDNYISLKNRHIANIIGRGLVIHADADDCGLGGDEESLITGNSGKRIACAVIGIKEY
jgi:Cu-Zn family superoxide dismutase